MKRLFASLLARQDHPAYLLGRMAEHLDVDLADAAQKQLGTCLIRMAGTCRACPNQRICQRFLECGDTAQGPAEFCPNAANFREFRRRAAPDASRPS